MEAEGEGRGENGIGEDAGGDDTGDSAKGGETDCIRTGMGAAGTHCGALVAALATGETSIRAVFAVGARSADGEARAAAGEEAAAPVVWATETRRARWPPPSDSLDDAALDAPSSQRTDDALL